MMYRFLAVFDDYRNPLNDGGSVSFGQALLIALVAILIVFVVLCLIIGSIKLLQVCVMKIGKKNEAKEEVSNETSEAPALEEESVQIANPIVPYSSAEEAANQVGHLSTLPTIYARYFQSVSVIGGRLIQIVYSDDEGEVLTLREELGDAEDISGNYNTYSYVDTFDYEGKQVTVKGESEDSIHVAIWNDGTYAHSLDYVQGAFLEEVAAAISEIN